MTSPRHICRGEGYEVCDDDEEVFSMKKRILSLALALSLAVSLVIPAYAVEDATEADLPEVVTDGEAEAAPEDGIIYLDMDDFAPYYIEKHPELHDAFDADAWFAEEYTWCTKEEYMGYMNLKTEEEFRQRMWERFVSYWWYSDSALVQEISDAHDAYLLEVYEALHPGELDGLTTEELLARKGYTETLTPTQQFMKDRYLDSEDQVRPSLIASYVWSQLKIEQRHAQFLSYQETYPDRWAEFDADAYFAKNVFSDLDMDDTDFFEDYKESYMEWEDLATEEAFVEEMFLQYVEGNRWLWDADTDPWYQPQVRQPSLVINGSRYTGEDFYIEDGVSYLDGATLNELLGTEQAEGPVALRAAAQAAGWDVVWNETLSQVNLLNREKLTHGVLVPGYGPSLYVEYDFSYMDTALERLMAAGSVGNGKSLRSTQETKVTLTLMDSLDGDKTYDFGMTLSQLTHDGLFNWDLTLDLADLKELLGEDLLDQMMSDMTKPNRQTLVDNLGTLRGRVIWNMEEETLYWNLPILSLVDESLDPEDWYSQYLPVSEGTVDLTGGVGAMVYASLLENCATSSWSDGQECYQEFARNMVMANTLFGADTFTWEGEELIWSFPVEALNTLLNGATSYMGGRGDMSLFKEFDCSLTLGADGSVSMQAVIRPDMEGIARMSGSSWYSAEEIALMAWALGLMDFRFTAEAQSKDGSGTAHMEFHWKNQMKLTVDSEAVTQATDDLPLSAPPQGSTVQEL